MWTVIGVEVGQINFVKDDIGKKGVSTEMMPDRGKKKMCANPT